MTVSRRNFLLFLGASAGSIALNISNPKQKYSLPLGLDRSAVAATKSNLPFAPVKVPLPLPIEGIAPQEQITRYASYEVQDDLILPEGYEYQVIAAWGDRVGESRFGYNNDYLSIVETAPNEGYLTVNFEYISGGIWMNSYPTVIGRELPFEQVKAQTNEDDEIDAFTLADDDALKTQIKEISKEGLIDQGMGVISVRRNPQGKWKRTFQ